MQLTDLREVLLRPRSAWASELPLVSVLERPKEQPQRHEVVVVGSMKTAGQSEPASRTCLTKRASSPRGRQGHSRGLCLKSQSCALRVEHGKGSRPGGCPQPQLTHQ